MPFAKIQHKPSFPKCDQYDNLKVLTGFDRHEKLNKMSVNFFKIHWCRFCHFNHAQKQSTIIRKVLCSNICNFHRCQTISKICSLNVWSKMANLQQNRTSFSSKFPVISRRFLKIHALINSTLKSWSKMTGSLGIFCCARYKIFLAWSALPFLSNWNRAASIHTATLWGYLPTYSSYNFDNWVLLFHFSNRLIWVFQIFSSSGHKRCARRRILFKRFFLEFKTGGMNYFGAPAAWKGECPEVLVLGSPTKPVAASFWSV